MRKKMSAHTGGNQMPARRAKHHETRAAAGAKEPAQTEVPIQIIRVIDRPAHDFIFRPELLAETAQVNVAERERIAEQQHRDRLVRRVGSQRGGAIQFIVKPPHVLVRQRHTEAGDEFERQPGQRGERQQKPNGPAGGRFVKIGSR